MKFLTQARAASVATLALLFSLTAANAVEVYKSKVINLDIYGNIALGLGVGTHGAYMVDGALRNPSGTQFRADGIFGVDAYTIAPNGYRIGARAEIELRGKIETFKVYLSGPFGEFMFGQAENASNYLHLTHPEYLAPHLATLDWTDFAFYPRNSANEGGTGLQFGDSTFLGYDDIALQLVYLSPTIQGFSFAISWTPNPCSNIGSPSVFKGSSGSDECGKIQANALVPAQKDYTIANVITLATRFARQESFGLDWAVSGAYLFGERTAGGNKPYAYSLGLNASYAGFHIGGAWQNSSNLNDANLEDKVWTAGIAYHKDNWRIGSAYRQSRRVMDDNASIAFNREVEVGLSYELAKNFWTSISFEYIWDRKTDAVPRSTKSLGGALYLSYAF